MIHLLGNGKQQIVTHGNPNLCEDSILCRSEERLDMEVLLDPFEEQLNLPALAVKFRYCYRLKSEIISQESVYIVGVIASRVKSLVRNLYTLLVSKSS